MSILQSTFDKHKKLMLESVGVINETELYHAAKKKDLESFVKDGIKPELAGRRYFGKGASQGKGFYVYKTKASVLDYAAEDNLEMVVVIDRPFDGENFDVDYEALYNYAGKFLVKYIDFVKKYQKELGVDIILYNQDGSPKALQRGGSNVPLFSEYPTKDQDMSQIFSKMELLDKPLFDKFESWAMTHGDTFKYNGKEKIFPVRIEDLQGNILWQNKK